MTVQDHQPRQGYGRQEYEPAPEHDPRYDYAPEPRHDPRQQYDDDATQEYRYDTDLPYDPTDRRYDDTEQRYDDTPDGRYTETDPAYDTEQQYDDTDTEYDTDTPDYDQDQPEAGPPPAPEPEPEPEPKPPSSPFILYLQGEEHAEALRMLTMWVRHLLIPIYAREVSSNAPWCSRWWLHPEAVAQLYGLWMAWQELTGPHAGFCGPANWHRDYLGPVMNTLRDPSGPFAGCKAGAHRHKEPPHTDPY
ncbi:DUF4913 domain-containing protein [Micromonospora sp. SH-82]|uniref:DUF4913 domain-containing protein n=1 Tax=Micromonospora sp. SH-82 TaxID=3132938 RepID=UPI003EBB8829